MALITRRRFTSWPYHNHEGPVLGQTRVMTPTADPSLLFASNMATQSLAFSAVLGRTGLLDFGQGIRWQLPYKSILKSMNISKEWKLDCAIHWIIWSCSPTLTGTVHLEKQEEPKIFPCSPDVAKYVISRVISAGTRMSRWIKRSRLPCMVTVARRAFHGGGHEVVSWMKTSSVPITWHPRPF